MGTSNWYKPWFLAALAFGGVIGSAALVYTQLNRSDEENNESESNSSTLEQTTSVSDEEEPTSDTSDESMVQEIDHQVADTSISLQTGTMFLAILGVAMMTIVLFVSIILVATDTNIDDPYQFRLFSPLMWISFGIIAASITQSVDHQTIISEVRSKSLNSDSSYASSDSSCSRDSMLPDQSTSLKNDDNIEEKKESEENDISSNKSILPEVSESVHGNSTIIEQAEALYKEMKHEELKRFLLDENSRNPGRVEILWRLARAYNDLAAVGTSPDIGKSLAMKGLECAEEALSCNSNSAEANKWVAIMTSTLGGYCDTKTKISGAYKIRDYIKRAIELDPKDATSRNIYGQWCLALADMTWIERKAAAALFGTPPTSTYDEALEQFLLAEEISPGFWKQNTFLIGQTYYKLKKWDKAKEWLEKANKIAIVTSEDKDVHEKIMGLMKKLS